MFKVENAEGQVAGMKKEKSWMEEIRGSLLSQVQSIDTSEDGVLSSEEKKLRINLGGF